MENNKNMLNRRVTDAINRSPGSVLEIVKEHFCELPRRVIDRSFFTALKKVGQEKGVAEFLSLFSDTLRFLKEKEGVQSAYNLLLRIEAALEIRKPTLAIYDHTFHIIGGGEKYGFTVAYALQDIFDITILANKKVTHENILDWYHLDLSKCKIKIIPIPFFDEFDPVHLDPARVSKRAANPFHIIAKESGNYDFFINNGMNEMVYPLANMSFIICHFPERRPISYFYADKYTYIIYNSNYTAGWIEKKWKFSPHRHIYPPVDMEPAESDLKKENIIISVARFEIGGSKKQVEMVRTFRKLCKRVPGKLSGWKLVLIGGSHEGNPYLEKIRELLKAPGAGNIELKINIPVDELKDLYKKAKIFWHLCGLDQSDPALVEHFGMTIVEAMQNKAAPIVFDGGGQREIVEQGKSGFRVTTTAELIKYTLQLIEDPEFCQEMGKRAFDRSKRFNRERFDKEVREYFNEVLADYKTAIENSDML
jgi:glycosyltransferase involved in cell wall biosynthesis